MYKDTCQGVVKEGEVYTVFDIRRCPMCNLLRLNVGAKTDKEKSMCTCGHKQEVKNGCVYLNSILFRPLDDLFNEEIEELMNEIKELCPA